MTRTEALWFGFFPQWIVANGIGWSVAYSLVSTTGFRYSGHFGVYMSAGLFIGFLQWLVLKRHLHMEMTWILVSAFPYGAFLLSFRFIPDVSQVQLFYGGIILFVIGLFQRSTLEYYLDNSILWVLTSAATGTVGLLVIPLIKALLFAEGSPAVFGVLYGTFYGAITGIALIFLFAKTIEKQTVPGQPT